MHVLPARAPPPARAACSSSRHIYSSPSRINTLTRITHNALPTRDDCHDAVAYGRRGRESNGVMAANMAYRGNEISAESSAINEWRGLGKEGEGVKEERR